MYGIRVMLEFSSQVSLSVTYSKKMIKKPGGFSDFRRFIYYEVKKLT